MFVIKITKGEDFLFHCEIAKNNTIVEVYETDNEQRLFDFCKGQLHGVEFNSD